MSNVNPFASAEVKQAIDNRRHMDTTKGYPADQPAKLEGRHQTITQRVTSFELTSSTLRGGVGVWRVMCHDANGTHTNEFQEQDPVCSQLFTRWVPFQRGKLVKLDGTWDLTWKNVDGWATAVSFQEVEDVAKKDAEAKIDQMHAEAVKNRPHTEFDEHMEKVECPTCHGDGSEKDNPNKACPQCFGDGWVYKTDAKPDPKPATPPGERPTDPQNVPYFVQNHMKKHLGIDGIVLNKAFKECFDGLMPDVYLRKNNVEATYARMDTYVAQKLGKRTSTPSGPQNGKAPETGATSQANPVPPQGPPAKPQETAPIKPTDKPVETVSGEIMPDPLPPATDEPSKEIILFDARRAISRAEAAKAVVDRMYAGGVLVKDVDYGPVPGTEKPTLLKPGAEKLLTAFHLYDQFKSVEVIREWNNGFFFYEYECTLYDRETGKAIGSGIGSCNSMEKKYRYRWVTEDRVPRHMNKADLPSKGGKVSEPEFAIEKGETTGKYGKPAAYWQQFRDAIANGTAVAGSRDTKNGKPMKTWEIDTTMYGIPNEDIFDQVNTISKMAQKRALVAAALNATGASAVFTQDMEDFADFGVFDAA